MKKLYFLLLTLICFSFSYSQGLEDFTNSNATTGYADNSFTGNNGITWSYVASRDANGDANGSGINLPALMLRRSSDGSKITSSTISGGIGDFSVKLYKGFTGGGDRQVEVFINGASVGTSTPFDDFSEHIFTVNGINTSGDIVIEIINTTSKQVIIDDITWTGYTGTSTPLLSISSDVSGLDYFEGNGPSAEQTFSVSGINLTGNLDVTAPTNFEISSTSGSGFGSSVSLTPSSGTVASTTLYVRLAAGLSANTYTDVLTASSTGATSETINVSGVVTPSTPQFSVFGTPDPLNYGLGNGPSNEDSIFVEGLFLTNDITVTAPTNFEVSLTSGSGFAGSVTVTQTSGTVASTEVFVRLAAGLTVGAYNGDITVSSSPAADQTVALTGNVFGAATNALVLVGVYDGPLTGGVPKGIELMALADIPDLSVFGVSSITNGAGSSAGTVEYNFPADAVSAGDRIFLATESTGFNDFFGMMPTYTNAVVGINGDDAIELYEGTTIIDTFGDVNTDGTGQPWDYEDGWAYRVDNTGPDGGFVLANWTFSEANALDGESVNSTATTPYPIATYTNNVLSNATFTQTNNFSIYPNPVKAGYVNINTTSNEAINVTVFDLLGKKVITKTLSNNKLNVSSLKSGVYLLNIEQNGASTTKKLVIE